MYASGLRARRPMPVPVRRRNPGAGQAVDVAVVTTGGRILAMRLLLTTTLLLALALHWLR